MWAHFQSNISEYFALLSIFQNTMHITFDRWIAARIYVNSDLGHSDADREELEGNPAEKEAEPEKSTN